MIPAVFIEGTDVAAYGIVRSLGRRGLAVAVLNEDCRDVIRYSRYCRCRHVYPIDPAQPHSYASDSLPDNAVLCRLLLSWAPKDGGKPVLFATSDWFARLLAHHSQELAERFLFHWISPELFATISDKGRMAACCERAGVCVPRTHVTAVSDDLSRVSGELPYPCLVKPLHRYTVSFPGPSKVFVAESAQSLRGFFAAHPQLLGATLIQEMIEGGDDQIFQCTALISNSGELSAFATVRKLRQYRPGYGSMCYGRTEPNDTVAAEALKLLKTSGYRGLGSLEFKYRARDGRYYFIEMNARLPWYNGVFDDGGVNLAYLAYEDLVGTSFSRPLPRQRDHVCWMSVRENRYWYQETDHEPHKFWRWVASVATARSYAWWNWRDPMPFLMSLLRVPSAAVDGLWRNLLRAGLRRIHAAASKADLPASDSSPH